MNLSYPGSGGGLEAFVRLLATAEETAVADILCLCVGSTDGELGHAQVQPIAPAVKSEFDYVIRLRRLIRSGRLRVPRDAIVLAPADHYAWPFLGTRHRIIVVAHGAIPKTLAIKHGPVRSTLFSFFVESRVVRRAACIAAINNSVRRHYAHRYRFLSPTNLVVVPVGVDFRAFERRPRNSPHDRHGVPVGIPVIVFVGRLSPEKGVDLAVAACDEVIRSGSSICLAVVGDGPEAGRVMRLMNTRPWIRWLPLLPPDDLLDLLSVSTTLLIASSYEAGPQVLLEAIATGIPVVSTNVGRAEELLKPYAGKVVPREAQSIANALRETIAWDRDKVRQSCLALRPEIDFRTTARTLLALVERVSQEAC